jgi:hypothetical protein
MYQITKSAIVDKYALLFTFSGGKQVLFDFSRFEGEFWFERVKERFASYSTDISGIWWGEDGISPIKIYNEGIDYQKIAAVA